MTTVVNLYKENFDVYIGRDPKYGNTKWGNPFKDPTMPLDVKLKNYEEYVRNDEYLWTSLIELKDRKLGCTCKPKPCHGDILIKLINEKFNIKEANNEWFDL